MPGVGLQTKKTQRSFVFVCKQKQSYLLICLLSVTPSAHLRHGDQWLKRTLSDNGCDKALWVYISLYFSNMGHPMVARLKRMVLPAIAHASFTSCLLAWIASIQMLIDTFSVFRLWHSADHVKQTRRIL